MLLCFYEYLCTVNELWLARRVIDLCAGRGRPRLLIFSHTCHSVSPCQGVDWGCHEGRGARLAVPSFIVFGNIVGDIVGNVVGNIVGNIGKAW